MALRGGLFHALLTSHDSESNQPGRSTRITCFFQALVSRWIRLVSRWIRLVVAGSPPPVRKKHTDRVFISSACESLDQACESLDQACRLKPSMVQLVHEVHPVLVVALSTVMMIPCE